MTRKNIAFIGLGVMGQSMAGHLLAAGHSLTVYNRTKSKAEGLLQDGATWANSPAKAAAKAEIVVTIVGYPADVEAVYLGKAGLMESVPKGALLIDMTTSSPQLAQRIAEAALAKGAHSLDAPVSGGDLGAREARLSIMVGGDKAAFEKALPVLELMGTNVVHQGPAGSGQYTKMCNQIAIASGMLGICEALHYAKAAGLDPETVLKSISGGAAGSWSLSNLAPRILKGDFAPGFYVKHFIKDMGIAIESARELGLQLPGLKLAESLYQLLAKDGGADLGTQALFKLYAEDKLPAGMSL